MAYQFRNIEKIIGTFIVLAFLLLIGAVIFIAKGQKIISKKNYYTTTFYSAMDLASGMPVTFKGLKIGAVKKIYLDKVNQIAVEFYILKEHANVIKTNSVVKISSASIISEKLLDITEGTPEAKPAKNNSLLYSFHTAKGLEMLEFQSSKQTVSPADKIIENVALLTAQLSNPAGPLQTILRNLERFTSVFAGLSGDNKETLSVMIKDLQITTKNFKEMSESMKKNPLIGGWGAAPVSDTQKKKK